MTNEQKIELIKSVIPLALEQEIEAVGSGEREIEAQGYYFFQTLKVMEIDGEIVLVSKLGDKNVNFKITVELEEK